MWSDDDRQWLAANYPGLKPTDSQVIEGRLSFQMLHLRGVNYIRPSSDFVAENSDDGTYICDTYHVKFELIGSSYIPSAYETAGRIAAEAQRRGKPVADLHMYSDTGSLCLASAMELGRVFHDSFSLATFVDEFVVPFLFAQTHYAIYDTWPWGELAHGYKGILQWLGRREKYDNEDIIRTYYTLISQDDADESQALLAQRQRGFKACLCGSGRKARDCCPELIKAIQLLRGAKAQGVIKD